METKVTFKALDCIENIYNLSRDCHLEKSFFETAKSDIILLSPYLKLNDIETVLFANLFLFLMRVLVALNSFIILTDLK